LECFGLQPNNQEIYAQTKAEAGFSASNWSKISYPHYSDCRRKW